MRKTAYREAVSPIRSVAQSQHGARGFARYLAANNFGIRVYGKERWQRGSESRMFSSAMISEDSFQYAIESTKVVLAPDRRIETFGSTNFRFHLVTELMDRAGVVRIRDGKIEAERPQIIAPGHYSRLMLEGFGEQARNFAEWLENRPEKLAFLKYGFQFRKRDVVENVVHGSVEEVVDRVKSGIGKAEEPLSAIILGVDDAWEVCLLKFTIDLIQQSAGGNMNDFRQRGLL